MNVVLVTAEEFESGRVVLPPKTVREVREWHTSDNWTPWTGDESTWARRDPTYTRECTVSQTLPESQCPECDGTGGGPPKRRTDECPTCEGRGSLAVVHLAIERWSRRASERRQAIVGYVTPTVLPVVRLSEVGRTRPPAIAWDKTGTHWFDADGSPIPTPDEPWAQGLEVGSVVLEFDTVTPIDPPIVEQWADAEPGALALDGSPEHMTWLPLSLEHGQLTEVEW